MAEMKSVSVSEGAYQAVATDQQNVRIQTEGGAVRLILAESQPEASAAHYFVVENHIKLDDLSPGTNVYVRAQKGKVSVRSVGWNPGERRYRSPSDIDSAEEITSVEDGEGEIPAVSLDVYKSVIATSGSGAAEVVDIPEAEVIGQRKLIVIGDLNSSDTVEIDATAFVLPDGGGIDAIEFDAEGEFLLAEWNGEAWVVLYASSGVVTPSA